MCTSWPQACITGTARPSASRPVAALAHGSPVSSRTGRASRSVRSITTGPGPLRSTPTTPWPPTPVVTAAPVAESSAAIRAAVRASCRDSSGAAWSSRQSAASAGSSRSTTAAGASAPPAAVPSAAAAQAAAARASTSPIPVPSRFMRRSSTVSV